MDQTMKILCSIGTRGRYDTTLPLVIQSVIMQTRKPDKLLIFDDNDNTIDLRTNELYRYLFMILDENKIDWEVRFGERKGPHFNHQKANTEGFDFVWRLDDDTIPNPNTLEELLFWVDDSVGAVGGAVLTPPLGFNTSNSTGLIDKINSEPNIQWNYISSMKEVEHLHCSFLYRAGVVDYNLSLSKVGHREETLFTYALKQKGYRVLVVPRAVTWHLRNSNGGIRDGDQPLYFHDEKIFQCKDKTIIVLDNGIGDHIVFKHVLPEIKNPLIFSCYPEVVPGKSIAEAQQLLGNLSQYNIYMKMDEWNWKGSLEDAFRKLYVK